MNRQPGRYRDTQKKETCAHTQMHIMNTHLHIHAYTDLCTHTYTLTHTHPHIYINTGTHTHPSAPTHSGSWQWGLTVVAARLVGLMGTGPDHAGPFVSHAN